jgi:hypothetical protein
MADLGEGAAPVEGLEGASIDAAAGAPDSTLDASLPGADGGPPSLPSPSSYRPSVVRASPIPGIVVAALFVAVGLIAFGLITRPQSGGAPGPGGQVAPTTTLVAPAPPIVGLSILSPTDGQAVAAAEVTVIGTAPPGVSVTQDISFGLDQHASVDGTGHWAIKVGLNEGDNKLTFRIGDDHSTEKTIRVTYTPARTP